MGKFKKYAYITSLVAISYILITLVLKMTLGLEMNITWQGATAIMLVACIFTFISWRKKEGDIKFLIYIVAVLTFFSGYITFSYYSYKFYYPSNQGTLYEEASPVLSADNKYTANAYFREYGTTGGKKMWINITDNETEKETTIYFAEATDHLSMNFEEGYDLFITTQDDNEIEKMKLTVGKEIYDETGGAYDTPYVKRNNLTCYVKSE